MKVEELKTIYLFSHRSLLSPYLLCQNLTLMLGCLQESSDPPYLFCQNLTLMLGCLQESFPPYLFCQNLTL
jgi:hypothetical protein